MLGPNTGFSDFDYDLFGTLSMSFLIPLAIVVIVWFVLMHFGLNWMPMLYARPVFSKWFNLDQHSALATALVALFWVFFILPFAGFIAFGVTCAFLLDPMVLGVVIAIAPTGILLLLFVYQNYHSNGYSMTLMFKICVPICALMFLGCTLLDTLLLDPISWMGAGFTFLWPPLLTFAGLLVANHLRLSKKGLSTALESQENMDTFSNNMAQKQFANWVEGNTVFKWYYSIIIIVVSIICNGAFVLLFNGKPEQMATNYTAGASLLVDILLVASQYTIETQGSLFGYIFCAYFVKAVAVCFSSRFWFVGHGLIYFFVGTYFLTNCLRGLWRKFSTIRRNEQIDQDEFSVQLATIDPIKKAAPFPDILMGGVCYAVLTIGIIIEAYVTYNKATFEVLPFGLTQFEVVVGCLILTACCAVSIVMALSFSRQRSSWINLVIWCIPQLAVLLVSALWDGLEQITGCNYLLFPVYFLLSAILTIYAILKDTNFELPTHGPFFANFISRLYTLPEYFLFSLAALAFIDVVILCVFPFFFVDNVGRCAGIMIVCFIIALAGYLALLSNFNTYKEMNLINWVFAGIATAAVAGFSASLLPFGITWYMGVGVFCGIGAILLIVFTFLWVKMCRWMLNLKQLLMVCIPSGILAVFAIYVLIAFEIDIPAAVLSFIFLFVLFGSATFYNLQRAAWQLTWKSITCISLLVVFCIALVAEIVIDLSDAFSVITVLLLITFVVSFVTMLAIISSRSVTDKVVFSNVFFPVRLYSRGELRTMGIFPYVFCFSFLAPWIWGLIASIFFDYPQFGPLCTSAGIVIIGFIALYLIYDFDTKTIDSLQYISDEIIKFAIEKALKCNSISIGQETIERSANPSYEEFVEYINNQHDVNVNRSMFQSSIKAQLSISAEVAFASAIQELYTFFKSKGFECEFFRTETSWDVKQRQVVFSLIDALHTANRAQLQKEAEYHAFVQQQEEERARRIAARLRLKETNPFAHLVGELVRNKSKFDDPEFAPNTSMKCDESLLKGCTYKRLEDVYQGMTGQYTIDDIQQGQLGDCYFIAALVAISKDEQVVRSLFSDPISPEHGALCVNFWYLGKRVPVIVDSTVPIKNNIPRFVRPHSTSTPYWFAIVEKAFAKNAGSWMAIDGGNSHIALHRLTGGWPTFFSFASLETKEQIASGELFDTLLECHRHGDFLCAGSASGEDTNKSKENIVLGHAYTILRVEAVNGHQLLQLRNTWGHMEWNGDWGDDSPLWTPKMKQLLDYRNADDGIFWMNFTDFTHQFGRVYACIQMGNDWQRNDIDGVFEPGGIDGHKPLSRDKPADVLPQYLVRFNQPTTIRGIFEKAGAPSPFWVYIVNAKGKKVKLILLGTQYISEPVAKSSELMSFEWHFDSIAAPWTLLVCRNPANESTVYHLTLYSDNPIEITPLD